MKDGLNDINVVSNLFAKVNGLSNDNCFLIVLNRDYNTMDSTSIMKTNAKIAGFKNGGVAGGLIGGAIASSAADSIQKTISEFQSKLMNLSDTEINSLQNEETITMEIGGVNSSITKEMVEIRINAKEGFDAAYQNNNFIVLNTNLTDDLIDEGIVRELISKVQNLRKSKDFNIMDRIIIYYNSEINLEERLNKYLDFIKKETLCDKIINEHRGEEVNLNGISTYLDVERV